MALRHVIGLDHVVVAVRDLGAAAAAWKVLGFTISPVEPTAPIWDRAITPLCSGRNTSSFWAC
jgi:hypothetical protein